MHKIIAFDLETQYTADEVGGWSHIRDMRLAVGVTYDAAEDAYHDYTEQQAERLLDQRFVQSLSRFCGPTRMTPYRICRRWTCCSTYTARWVGDSNWTTWPPLRWERQRAPMD